MKNLLMTLLSLITMSISAQQEANENPFGLVYRGAITQNEKGKVNIHPVSYRSEGIDISANVYTPADYNPSAANPAIVVAHPNGGVKEQVAGLYAQRLAEAGYIAIAADAAYQGASGGEPRNTDKPSRRIEDIYAMADFISAYPGVDATRIGVLGICGGGGYTIKAVQTDKRFKAVATVSMFNSGLVRRNGFHDAQLSTIQERLQQASDARAKRIATGTSDKELFIVKGSTHIETYWKPEYVDRIVKKLSAFYGRILK